MLYAESKLRTSGLTWTILRDNMYLDPVADWAPDLVKMGRLPYPVKQGRVAYVSRDDLAQAIAASLLTDGHDDTLYELTGPEAVSMPELAEALSSATGHPIAFEQVTDEEYAELCRADGVPEMIIQALTTMYHAVDQGEFERVTDHIERLTGRPPRTVPAYLKAVL